MPRVLTLLFLLVTFYGCKKECPVLPPPPEVCKVDLSKGLLAYYPFNGNANDASGNSNHGILKNGASISSDFLGRPGRSASFDGLDDYIIAPDNGKFNADTITVSFMVMVNNTSRRHSFVGRNNFENASSVIWGSGQSLEGTNKFDYVLKSTSEACATPHAYDPQSIISSPENMVAKKWYQLIMTFANGTQSLYVDGVLKASTKRDFNTPKKCTADLLIGGWWKNDIISIDGKIDEIRIHNRLLNECEFQELTRLFKED